MRYKKETNKDAGSHDAVLEMIDEDSGAVLETSRFLKASRAAEMLDIDGSGGQMDAADLAGKRGSQEYSKLKGKQHPFKHKKRRLPD